MIFFRVFKKSAFDLICWRRCGMKSHSRKFRKYFLGMSCWEKNGNRTEKNFDLLLFFPEKDRSCIFDEGKDFYRKVSSKKKSWKNPEIWICKKSKKIISVWFFFFLYETSKDFVLVLLFRKKQKKRIVSNLKIEKGKEGNRRKKKKGIKRGAYQSWKIVELYLWQKKKMRAQQHLK